MKYLSKKSFLVFALVAIFTIAGIALWQSQNVSDQEGLGAALLGTCPGKPACNVGHNLCGTVNEVRTVPSGQSCTYTGTISNDLHIVRNPLTLTITGNGCSESIAVTGCSTQSFNVTCEPGAVTFAPNESAVLTISESCVPASTDVNGVCGSASGQTFATAPTTNLCSQGDASSVVDSGSQWTWACAGIDGGSSASCAANKPAECIQNADCTENICSGNQFCDPVCTTGQCVAGPNCNFVPGQCSAVNPLSISVPSQTILVGEAPQDIVISGGTPGYSLSGIDDDGTGLTATFDGNTTIRFPDVATGFGSLQGTVTDAEGASIDFTILVSGDIDPLSLTIPSQTISTGEVPQDIFISGGIPGYSVSDINDDGTGLTVAFDGNQTIRFPDAATGFGSLEGSVEDADGESIDFTVLVSEETLESFLISSSCAGQVVFVGDTCVLTATGLLSDGSTQDISTDVIWQGFEDIGEITDNVLSITERDSTPRTTAVISAIKDNVSSDNTFDIFVEERVPVIESIETLGNFGVQKATTETLYIRVASEQGQASLQDIEAWFVEGAFGSPEEIPDDAQRFAVVDNNGATNITEENTAPVTVLIELPLFIPDFEDMDDGPFTFLVNIHTTSGNVIAGVEPSFLGSIPSGDADGNGTLALVDVILILKMANREIVPTASQLIEVDFNRDGFVTVLDAIQALRLLFEH